MPRQVERRMQAKCGVAFNGHVCSSQVEVRTNRKVFEKSPSDDDNIQRAANYASQVGRQADGQESHLPDAGDVNISIVVAELPPVDRLVVHLHVLDKLPVERSDLRHACSVLSLSLSFSLLSLSFCVSSTVRRLTLSSASCKVVDCNDDGHAYHTPPPPDRRPSRGGDGFMPVVYAQPEFAERQVAAGNGQHTQHKKTLTPLQRRKPAGS